MIRRKDVGEPGNGGKFAHRLLPEAPSNLLGREPIGTIEWSRRAIINLVTEVLPDQVEALTLLGGHAVMLRTENTFGLAADTADGDFGVTPFAVTKQPQITQALIAAGFEQRDTSRPGMWGRGRTGDAETLGWNEKIDLLCGGALSGNIGKHRSVRTLASDHGKHAVGLADGIEMASVDRELIDVPDLVDPSRSAEVYVAGTSALICAKAYKLSERLEANRPGRLKAKDAADLFRLMDTADPAEAAGVFARHSADPVIGAAVARGAEHLRTVLTSSAGIELFVEATRGRVAQAQLDGLLNRWTRAFGRLA